MPQTRTNQANPGIELRKPKANAITPRPLRSQRPAKISLQAFVEASATPAAADSRQKQQQQPMEYSPIKKTRAHADAVTSDPLGKNGKQCARKYGDARNQQDQVLNRKLDSRETIESS